jgi:hypothetical protein
MTSQQEPHDQATPATPSRPAPPRRSFGSSLAVLAAGILLILGLILSFAAFASLSQPGRPDLGPVYAMTSLVTQAALLVVGVLNVAAAVGIYLHIGWARRLAIALASLGLIVSAVFLVGPLTTFKVQLLDPLTIATWLAILGYGYGLLAMLLGGSHFRPRVAA